MANDFIRANKTLNGASGQLWIDNQLIAEFSKVTAKITADRKDVQLGLSVDSKIVALKGEGSVTINKVYSRARKILDNWAKGLDVRTRIITTIADPDAVGKQEERISIDNVWFNDLDLVNIARGEVIEEEYSFGFTPQDVKFESEIK